MLSQIIDEEIASYEIQTRERKLAPVIAEFQTQSLLVAEQELDILLREMSLSPQQAQQIGLFTRQLTAKLFHQGVTALKNNKHQLI